MKQNVNFGQRVRRLFGVMLCGAALLAAKPSQAASEQWEQFVKADTRIEACRVTWKDTLTLKPKRKVEVELRVARAMAQARQKGLDAAGIKRQGEMERKFALEDQKGHSVVSELTVTRVGDTLLCDLQGVVPQGRMIDYFDGKNVIHLFRRQDAARQLEWDGVLLRDEREVLSHTLRGWMMPQFLAGMPFTQKTVASWTYFSDKDSSLKTEPGGALRLQKQSDLEEGVPVTHQMSVAKESLRPISYEVVHNLIKEGQAGRVLGHAQASGYKRYADGVWLPSKVTLETPVFVREFTLIKASLNEAVDPLEVRLPPKTRLADSRFGLGKNTVSYQVKDGVLPSDEEIRQMLGTPVERVRELQKTQAELQENELQKAESALVQHGAQRFTPLAGLLLMCFGCVLWGRSKREDSDD